jgi:hypothetical protein
MFEHSNEDKTFEKMDCSALVVHKLDYRHEEYPLRRYEICGC